jgi:uncharacterized protein (DUF1778 family)
LQLRTTPEVKHLLQRAADIRGVSLTEYVVMVASERAAETIREQETLTLSAGDSRVFVDALMAPPREPNPALRAARERHRELLGE